MTEFKIGDEVLVRGVIEALNDAQKPEIIKVGEYGYLWLEEFGKIIPVKNYNFLLAYYAAMETGTGDTNLPGLLSSPGVISVVEDSPDSVAFSEAGCIIHEASALDVNKQLLEALKPFAKLAAMFDDDVDDSWGIVCESTDSIMIRDLRRARDAVAAAEKGSRND